MLGNYLITAFRNIRNQKLFTVINVLGLSLALATCLLIIGYLSNELSYESCHKNRDEIYRLSGIFKVGNQTIPMAPLMSPLANVIREEIPDVRYVVKVKNSQDTDIFTENLSGRADVFYVEKSIFEVFTLPLLEGDPDNVFVEPMSVVISAEAAMKYFGQKDVLGRTVTIKEDDYVITGVMQKIPPYTQLRADFYANYSSLEKKSSPEPDNWENIMGTHIFLMFENGIDQKQFIDKVYVLMDKYYRENSQEYFDLFLQPLKDIYLNSKLSNELQYPLGNETYIYVFSLVAFLMLLMACFNYMNLASARISHRLKEVGIRKIFGAFRKQLTLQFLIESLMITIAAFILSLVFYELTKPVLENFVGKEIFIGESIMIWYVLAVIAIILIIGVLAGLYPALLFSGMRPINVINELRVKHSRKGLFRTVLVTLQFAVAMGLLIVTFFISKQLSFFYNEELGFDKDNILVFGYKEIDITGMEVLKKEVESFEGVENLSLTASVPGESSNILALYYNTKDKENPQKFIKTMFGDTDYVETFGLKLIQGNDFESIDSGDLRYKMLVNEEFVKEFALDNPVGTVINCEGNNYLIIGVLQNFHAHDLYNPMQPIVVRGSWEFDWHSSLAIKYTPGSEKQIIKKIKSISEKVLPGHVIDYYFLDEKLKESYENEKKLLNLFLTYTSLILFIACMGILGLASYSAERRMKEFGIKKILGAGNFGLVFGFISEMLKFTILSAIIAMPVSYFIVKKWLSNFVYQTPLISLPFIIAFCITGLLTILSVVSLTFRIAFKNPVDIIKYE